MKIFNVISLFGGLALFLYGMRLMGDGLKSSSSGTLKKAMERITGTPLKAFLLGLAVTAVIQSSTATIVLTSGLVDAGIISLRQSLGIIIGFGILFSGLMNMTDAVQVLSDSGIVERLFSSLGQNPVLGYLSGAGVAFVLQSSSATIGILQAFSTSGQLTFGEI